MKKSCLFGFAALLLLAAAGCTSVATFDYDGAPGTMIQFPDKGGEKKSVAVLPYLDQRGLTSDGRDGGSFYLGLIPLMPFGFVTMEKPKDGKDFVSLGRFHFDPSNELAAATMLSLKASKLFGDVTRAQSIDTADADYVWQGSFRRTRYSGYQLTYCITYFFAPGLWVPGFPFGISNNTLWLDFTLIEKSTGRAVWAVQFNESDWLLHWIYARNGQDVSMFPILMKQAMNNALYDLNRRLPSL